jgi:hypothetical protein
VLCRVPLPLHTRGRRGGKGDREQEPVSRGALALPSRTVSLCAQAWEGSKGARGARPKAASRDTKVDGERRERDEMKNYHRHTRAFVRAWGRR